MEVLDPVTTQAMKFHLNCEICINVFPQTALELNGVLNSSKKQTLFHHDFLVPSGCLYGSRASLPTILLFLFSGKGVFSNMISWFLLAPARVPELDPLLTFLFFLFSGKGIGSIIISWFLLVRVMFPELVFATMLSFLRKGLVGVWGLCWCNFCCF